MATETTHDLCKENLAPDEVLCPPGHCARFRQTATFRRVCRCLDARGQPIPGCQPKGGNFPVETSECYNKATGEWRDISTDACLDLRDHDRNWNVRRCFCCCTYGGAEPRVATAEGAERPGREVAPGESVSAASARVVDGVLHLSWSPAAVALSETTPDDGEGAAVLLRYGRGGALALAPDHPVLTPAGTLAAAGGLAAGDRVVDPRGRAVVLTAVERARAPGGLHHLATDPAAGAGIDGHLLALNGVVVADHAVRLLRFHPRFAPAFAAG